MIKQTLIAAAILAATTGTQASVLYKNPYDPSGIGGSGALSPALCYFCQSATPITLTTASTIQAFSFIAEDLWGRPENAYTWSIYTDVNGMPSGVPGPVIGPTGVTYLPIASGQAETVAGYLPAGQGSMASVMNLVPVNSDGQNSIDKVTIKTGPVTLSAGNYFFALEGY